MTKPLNLLDLMKRNIKPRKQSGTIIETPTAFYVRYYTSETYQEPTSGKLRRKQKCEKLCARSDLYRSKKDVEPLAERFMQGINSQTVLPSGRDSLSDYVKNAYLPWVQKNKAATTYDGYRTLWNRLEPHVGKIALANLRTEQVTALLTYLADSGFRARSLSHAKWFLSGIYEYAVATGTVTRNPVPAAKWLTRPKESAPTVEYSLAQTLEILRVLEPLNLGAAVAVALGFFGAMRPIEISGLRWSDYDGNELHVQRGYCMGIVALKTKGSNRRITMIEPLRSLHEKLRREATGEFILTNGANNPWSLDSLNIRVITPALKAAGITYWEGYYAVRRGMSS